MARAEQDTLPALRVLDICEIPGDATCCRVLLSDGRREVSAMLKTQLVSKEQLAPNTNILLSERDGNAQGIYLPELVAGVPRPLEQMRGRGANPAAPTKSVTPIADLTWGDTWTTTIKARITNKSTIRQWDNENGSGVRLVFELLDHSGEIRCVALNEQADWLFKQMQINHIYCITRFFLKPVTEDTRNTYRLAIKHHFELILTAFSEVELCEDESSIPQRQYSFVPIAKLQTMVQPGDVVAVDVIGVCKYAGDPEPSPVKTTDTIRNLQLVDQSSGRHAGITLTLWGAQARELDQQIEAMGHPELFVIAIKRARLSDYNGGTLNSGDTNMIQINPDLDEAQELNKWF